MDSRKKFLLSVHCSFFRTFVLKIEHDLLIFRWDDHKKAKTKKKNVLLHNFILFDNDYHEEYQDNCSGNHIPKSGQCCPCVHHLEQAVAHDDESKPKELIQY